MRRRKYGRENAAAWQEKEILIRIWNEHGGGQENGPRLLPSMPALLHGMHPEGGNPGGMRRTHAPGRHRSVTRISRGKNCAKKRCNNKPKWMEADGDDSLRFNRSVRRARSSQKAKDAPNTYPRK
jgi:hypothetical protein